MMSLGCTLTTALAWSDAPHSTPSSKIQFFQKTNVHFCDSKTADSGLLRYEFQLPRLPVNSLQETTDKWLHSVKPFTVDVGDAASFERAQALVKDLKESKIGQTLQERLEKRAETEDNWLIDWWNNTAYFAPRDSLAFANYFFGHVDDRARTTGPARAASLIRALLYFRHMTESGILEPEMARKTPLAMSSYQYLFNACRFPQKDADMTKKFDPASNNHITVLRRGKFYEVQVVDSSGQFLSEADLRAQFEQVVSMAGTEEDPYPLGALTTWNRDHWAEAREELLSSAPENAELMDSVASSIFVLALDSVSPITREQKTRNWWIGEKSGNRFMDKHTLMVTDNGKSGFSGEHSLMDGTPTTRLNDWMIRSLAAGKIDLGSTTPRTDLTPPRHLDFKLNDKMKMAIDRAVQDVEALKAEHQITVLQYSGYGKEVIKNFNCSPDSWAQLVMQLAYYKMAGKPAATYESAQTRKFKFGRTEVIRSTTTEATQWCQAMEDSSVSNTDRLSLFQRAASAHIHYAQQAANGQGIDRHFFGLKKLLKEGEELPAIFSDPIFAVSSTWTLSTSQLSSEFFNTWGYSEVVDDGFGLAYSVNSDSLRFCIITKTGKDKELAHYLEEAAHEMRNSLGQGLAASEEAPKAKL